MREYRSLAAGSRLACAGNAASGAESHAGELSALGDEPACAIPHEAYLVDALRVVSEGVKKGSTYTLTVQAIGTDNYLSDLSAPLTVTIPTTVSRP